MLVVAQGVVSGVDAARMAVVNDDVTVERRGSGCRTGCWGLCFSAVGWAGSECRLFRDTGGSFEAGDGAVVVVVNDVVVVDGGCVGVVVGDMAASGGVLVCSAKVCVAFSLVLGAVWVLESTLACFSAVGLLLLSGSVCRAAQ